MRYLLLCLGFFAFSAISNPIDNFSEAKRHLQKTLPANSKTLYCGCDIKKQGKKLVPDTTACGYQARNPTLKDGKPNPRAERIEWEHIVSAWEFGHQLQCWQNGGRKNCRATSEQFRIMEADIHNLAPAIGEVNGDRSNYKFAMLPDAKPLYGACEVKIDFKQKLVEPPPAARKRIAEAYFYMEKTYGMSIADKQRKLFNAWLQE
ncbi:endonuclease [Pseudoalteromonas fenneropenaei]|uniref:Endonuclease n=1 Tax=Pseudoalteromonas fenneropenaei TaxID=1737459 RepID=A0ABV7CLY3_9GAMM